MAIESRNSVQLLCLMKKIYKGIFYGFAYFSLACFAEEAFILLKEKVFVPVPRFIYAFDVGAQ